MKIFNFDVTQKSDSLFIQLVLISNQKQVIPRLIKLSKYLIPNQFELLLPTCLRSLNLLYFLIPNQIRL